MSKASRRKAKRRDLRAAGRRRAQAAGGQRAAPPIRERVAATLTLGSLGPGVRIHPPPGTAAERPWLEANLDIGYLARELTLLRSHNLQFKEGDVQDTMLMFSEGSVVLVMMERFLRLILGSRATTDHTLPNLLEMAVSDELGLIQAPGGDRAHVVDLVTGLRNALLHGNYEQAAQQAGAVNVRDYFSKRYAKDIELLYLILNTMMTQIDPATGEPRDPASKQRHRRNLRGILVRRALQLDAAVAHPLLGMPPTGRLRSRAQ